MTWLNAIVPYVERSIVSLLVGGALTLVLWPFRKAHKEWTGMKNDLSAVHEELVRQRTNCLTTLQNQGEKQIELLTKSVAVLDGVRLDLAEQTGYLRAAVEMAPKRRHAVAKK